MPAKAKLRSRGGMTLTELLVSLVILSLLGLAVTTGISAGIQSYHASTALARSQSLLSTLTKAVADELRYAGDIQAAGDGALTAYTSQVYGEGAALAADANGHLAVSSRAMSQSAQLLGSGTYGEFTTAIELRYDESTGCFGVKLSIYEKGKTEALQALDFFIRALNPPVKNTP